MVRQFNRLNRNRLNRRSRQRARFRSDRLLDDRLIDYWIRRSSKRRSDQKRALYSIKSSHIFSMRIYFWNASTFLWTWSHQISIIFWLSNKTCPDNLLPWNPFSHVWKSISMFIFTTKRARALKMNLFLRYRK